MKAHIVTVINSRTHGLPPMMMGKLSDEDNNHHASSDESVESEDGKLYRSEIRNGKKFFTKSRHDSSKNKGGGQGRTNKNVSAVDALVTSERIAEPKTHLNGGHPKSVPKGKGVGSCDEEETETSQNVHWSQFIWVL